MTAFAIASIGGPPNVSSPFKTSSLSPTSTVDSNAEDAKTEPLAHVPPPPCSSMAESTTASTCALQLYNPIADTKEIVYDSSKAATCTAGSKSRDTNVIPSEDSTTGSHKANLLFLTLDALGGCLLRPRRHGNKSAKEAVAPRKGLRLLPKRRGIRGRLQLLMSRSSSSDGSDPTAATTLITGEQNRLLSGRGDSSEGFRTLPATHADELLESSVSEVCDVSFYANEDDNTLDDVSYAFSQAAGISEEEPRGYDDIGMGSIWDEIGTDSEDRRMSQADTDTDIDGADGGDPISLLFDDEDETDGHLFALSDANEDGENENNGENDDDEEDDDEDEPDELEYVQPSFTHKSLRQASEKQTSYDFIIDDNEEDDDLCAADGKHMYM